MIRYDMISWYNILSFYLPITPLSVAWTLSLEINQHPSPRKHVQSDMQLYPEERQIWREDPNTNHDLARNETLIVSTAIFFVFGVAHSMNLTHTAKSFLRTPKNRFNTIEDLKKTHQYSFQKNDFNLKRTSHRHTVLKSSNSRSETITLSAHSLRTPEYSLQTKALLSKRASNRLYASPLPNAVLKKITLGDAGSEGRYFLL